MSEDHRYDIAVLGGGPGGYVAAIRAAQSGKKVALVEKDALGGTCLNRGCIPTKALLANGHVLQKVRHAADFGITVGNVSFDFSKMEERKDQVVDRLVKGLSGLMQANKIRILRGHGKLVSPTEIKVSGTDSCVITAEKIIIATGSEPLDIKAFPCDHERILNSTSILKLKTLPKTLAIVGGGYIGCEFASLYNELGVRVIILEALPAIVSMQGKLVSEALTKAFKQKGIDIRLEVFVEGIEKTGSGLEVKLKGGQSVPCDMALVAVGRKLNTSDIGLESAGINVDEKGAIPVNDRMETRVPGIYAIGDVVGKWMLAHVASHQGIVAAVNAMGREAAMHYNAVPSVIFTYPEIACVGMTLEQAEAAGYQPMVGKFPFQALGKSMAALETEGFAQIIADRKTRAILGAQVVGAEASVLIAEIVLAITNELTLECLTETIHAHPTLPESWLEAALIAEDMPLNFPPKIKK